MKKKFILPLGLLFAIATLKGAETPRPEYPRPQFERAEWVNLNGTWSFDFDFSKSGMERSLFNSKGLEQSITVPFCPESPLSGIGYTDFIPAVWYQRTLSVPAEWAGKRVLLNFGGVDYKSVIFIDGKEVFTHYGGSSSFAVDVTDHVTPGADNNLVVYAEDDLRSQLQTAGKQSRRLYAYECFYTRVTGIWQTVWMEAVAKGGLKDCRITPDLDNKQFIFEPTFYDLDRNARFQVRVLDGGKTVFSQQVAASNSTFVPAKLKKVKTWSPESPFLYDVEFSVLDADGQVIDQVNSNVDNFLLGIFQGSMAVAVYGVARQITTVFFSFSTTISSVYAPRVNEMVASGSSSKALSRLMASIGRVQFVIMALVLSGLYFFGRPFIVLWAGDGYVDAWYIILLLCTPVMVPLIQNIGLEIQRAMNRHPRDGKMKSVYLPASM